MRLITWCGFFAFVLIIPTDMDYRGIQRVRERARERKIKASERSSLLHISLYSSFLHSNSYPHPLRNQTSCDTGHRGQRVSRYSY